MLDGNVETTLLARDKMILQGNVAWEGRWSIDTQSFEDSRMDLSLRYHRGQTRHRSLFASLEASYTVNPAAGSELGLGGDLGLRGYPNHYQNGDTRYLLSVEERIFTDYELWHLAHVGFAAFADVGEAYFRDGSQQDRGILKDVGFGLRLVLSKSTKGSVIHFDVAFPLDERDLVDSYQITASLKKTI